MFRENYKEYYADENMNSCHLGIYETLEENRQRISYSFKNNRKIPLLKSLGAFNKDKYLFLVNVENDKNNHIYMTENLEKDIGLYNFWFSIFKENDYLQHLNFYHTINGEAKNKENLIIELEYIINIILECMLYNSNNIDKVQIALPGVFFQNNEEQTFTDLEECLNIVQTLYYELKQSTKNNEKVKKLIILD